VYGLANHAYRICMNRREYLLLRAAKGLIRTPRICDNDIIYLWQLVGIEHEGLPVYKVGITSNKCKSTRIQVVARRHKVGFKVIAWTRVGNARAVETELLSLGSRTKIRDMEGYTEIRAYCPETLEKALKIIEKYSQSA
jgi:hypothetical protein